MSAHGGLLRMAWNTLHWRSGVLGKQTVTQVILPEVGRPPFPVYYLLHGLSDDSTTWIRRSRIEEFVAKLPLIVVMPDGLRGFYTDHEKGPAYAKHIAEELPSVIERHYHARPSRAARAIGGLSMGGYGALRLGFGYPDRYCSINSHSGAVGWGGRVGIQAYRDAARERNWSEEFVQEMIRIFGENPRNTPHDIPWLASRAKRAGRMPRVLMDCGTEDKLIEDNRGLHRELEKRGVKHEYREFPGGHTWEYWDLHVRDAIAFHAKSLRIEPVEG